VIAICLGFWLFEDKVAAYSSLVGGMIFTVPQLYFGLKAFMYMGARSGHLIVQNFYKGESSKMLLIALGFATTFKFLDPLNVFALFFTFVCALVSNVALPAVMKRGNG